MLCPQALGEEDGSPTEGPSVCRIKTWCTVPGAVGDSGAEVEDTDLLSSDFA